MSKRGKSTGTPVGMATLVLAAAVLAVAATSRGDGGPKRDTAGSGSDCTDGWSSCSPDARWLREVLRRAGHDVIGETGSALVIPSFGLSAVYVWSTGWHGPGDVFVRYAPLPRLAGTDIYVDRDGIRIKWRAQDRSVWVEPPPERRLLVRLVRLTQAVPPPND